MQRIQNYWALHSCHLWEHWRVMGGDVMGITEKMLSASPVILGFWNENHQWVCLSPRTHKNSWGHTVKYIWSLICSPREPSHRHRRKKTIDDNVPWGTYSREQRQRYLNPQLCWYSLTHVSTQDNGAQRHRSVIASTWEPEAGGLLQPVVPNLPQVQKKFKTNMDDLVRMSQNKSKREPGHCMISRV